MQRVSTNLTLTYKFFIPTFWTVFVGALTIAVFAMDKPYYGSIPGGTFRIGIAVFFLTGFAMFLFTIMRLKRVEMDEHFVFITNYFKSFRYPYHNIRKIAESKFLFMTIVTIHFQTPGYFGKKVIFIASNSRYRQFWAAYPQLRKQLVKTKE